MRNTLRTIAAALVVPLRGFRTPNDPIPVSSLTAPPAREVRRIGTLIEALRKSSTQSEAIEALGALGESAKDAIPALRTIAASDYGSAPSAAAAIGQMGEPGMEVLIDLAKGKNAASCSALATLGDRRALAPLIEAINDAPEKSRRCQLLAVRELLRPGDTFAVGTLIEVLRTGGVEEWREAGRGLSIIDDPRARFYSRLFTGDVVEIVANGEVRPEALYEALGVCPEVRLGAMKALRELGHRVGMEDNRVFCARAESILRSIAQYGLRGGRDVPGGAHASNGGNLYNPKEGHCVDTASGSPTNLHEALYGGRFSVVSVILERHYENTAAFEMPDEEKSLRAINSICFAGTGHLPGSPDVPLSKVDLIICPRRLLPIASSAFSSFAEKLVGVDYIPRRVLMEYTDWDGPGDHTYTAPNLTFTANISVPDYEGALLTFMKNRGIHEMWIHGTRLPLDECRK